MEQDLFCEVIGCREILITLPGDFSETQHLERRQKASSRKAAMFLKDQKDRLQEPTILEPYNVSARHHLSVAEIIHSVTL